MDAEHPAMLIEGWNITSLVPGWTVHVPRGGTWRFAWTPTVVPGPAGVPRYAAVALRMGSWTAPAAPGTRWTTLAAVPAVHRADAARSATVARVCYFARKWVARDRAWRWRCAKTGDPFVSLRGRAMAQNLEPRR